MCELFLTYWVFVHKTHLFLVYFYIIKMFLKRGNSTNDKPKMRTGQLKQPNVQKCNRWTLCDQYFSRFKCSLLNWKFLSPPHTSRFFVGRRKIFTCRLVCGEFRQVCDKIGACRAISDSARSQNVLCGGPRQLVTRVT